MVMHNRQEISDSDPNDNNTDIVISNFQNGETVTYSLVLIKGNVKNIGNLANSNKIICNSIYNNIATISEWEIHNGEFKSLVELKQGRNIISFGIHGKAKELTLEYYPRNTNLRVTPVYIICQGHDGAFQSPPGIDSSIESACSRIAIGAKLIQCLTAEKLFESGVGRKTFQLEQDINTKKAECSVFRSNLNVNKARKMKEHELWTHFGRELMLSELGSNERKFLAFISCTRFKGIDMEKSLSHDEIVSLTEAHAALGGGGLAIFGSACLYTWPITVQEVVPKFLDNTPINARRFMDDSCYRGTFGGCFATTLGSVCHELGHTFDLGHTKDGIMGRGFDNIDRVFTIGEKRSYLIKDYMNNSYSGKPVQHSTVSLQRNISVTVNVAEPLRVLGPRSKTTLGNFASFSNREIPRRGPNVTPITRPSSVYSNFSNRLSESKKNILKSTSDTVYWTKNCAVFLSYHRWFNNEYGREREAITRYLKFDKNKMLIWSTAGIRVVEVRDESTGLVLDSYEFTDTLPEKRFLVPFTMSSKSKVLVIVVEDDLGNVLKQIFSY